MYQSHFNDNVQSIHGPARRNIDYGFNNYDLRGLASYLCEVIISYHHLSVRFSDYAA